MGIVILIAFWTCVGLTGVNIGWKPALIFAALWIVGFFLFPILGLNSYLFLTYQAILAIPMAIWIKSKVF